MGEDEVARGVDYDPSRKTKTLGIGVEHAPACSCEGHVINKSMDAVSSLDRVPKRGVAAGLNGDPVILCSCDQTLAHSVIGNPGNFKCGDVAAEPRPDAGVALGVRSCIDCAIGR